MSGTLLVQPTGVATLLELAMSPLLYSDGEFLAKFDAPVLLIPQSAGGPGNLDDTPSPDPTCFTTMEVPTTDRAIAASYRDALVVPLRKSPRNVFQGMITIGRAMNNDIVFDASSVSKLHGYFRRAGAAWSYQDAGSRNGSFVQGQRLEKNDACALEDGLGIALGGQISFLYKTPAGLLAAARAVAGG